MHSVTNDLDVVLLINLQHNQRATGTLKQIDGMESKGRRNVARNGTVNASIKNEQGRVATDRLFLDFRSASSSPGIIPPLKPFDASAPVNLQSAQKKNENNSHSKFFILAKQNGPSSSDRSRADRNLRFWITIQSFDCSTCTR